MIFYDRFTDIYRCRAPVAFFRQEEVAGPRTCIEVTIKQGPLGHQPMGFHKGFHDGLTMENHG